MLSYSPTPSSFTFQQTLAPFLQDEALPFADILTPADVARVFADEGVDFGRTARALWTPASTLWAFLAQVLNADSSCRQAVAQVLILFALSIPPQGLDTAAYCRARAKLPAKAIKRLALEAGCRLEAVVPADWRMHGRRVILADGSTSALPDTPENQKAFPQSRSQQLGLGYPIIRWVALFGLATAALQGFAYGPYQGKETGETALFREMLDQLAVGDIIVADRYYCSYFLVAILKAHGVDVVFRLHQKRKYNFREGRHLGAGDHIVLWTRPARPTWMTVDEYESIPKSLVVREVRVAIEEPGFRVEQLILATTLLDAKEYPQEEIADLYHKRWHVELDIRTIKVTLQMDSLRCQTPFMVEKEIWVHCLAYNLVRKVAAQAAVTGERTARSLSFKATLQVVRGGWHVLTTATSVEYVARVSSALSSLSKEIVGDRPGRTEPRVVKRRPKPYKHLSESRAAAKARLIRGGSKAEKASAKK
jgi:putative transposase